MLDHRTTAGTAGPDADLAGPRRAPDRDVAHRRAVAWVAGGLGAALLAAAAALGGAGSGSEPTAQSPARLTVPQAPDPTPSRAPASTDPPGAAFDLASLPSPHPVDLLPAGLPQTTVSDLAQLPRLAAVPLAAAIPVWTAPDDSTPPVLALRDRNYAEPARWVVTQQEDDWVEVLMPEGRLALPSQDPARVNRAAGWVRATDVAVLPETAAAVVDLSDRTVTVTRSDGTTEVVPTGIGTPRTPTPLGLGQVLTVAESQVGTAVYTSFQSEAMDSFLGSGGAVVAFHVGVGQGREISNGCLRLTSAGFAAVRTLPVGAPVLIVP